MLLAALDKVGAELADGTFGFVDTDEDIHTAIERRVTEMAGETGAKLHTGRSRNDQVATAFRLWCKRAATDVGHGRRSRCRRCCSTAPTEVGDAYLPGYTHLQRAQPILLSHHLLAHGWALARDVDRLVDARRRLDVSPLGAGALAGSSLPLDPDAVAEELGFAAAFDNSLDAVADRDFVAELLHTIALLGVHLSRIGEEVVLWSTEEFGFLKLADAYSTGSSMLPAEEEPRHRRAGPRQGRAPDRPRRRLPGHAQRPAAGLQPGPPGGQGAAVRRRRPGPPGAGRPRRPARDGHVRPRPHGGRRRFADGRRRRPGRMARRAGARRSGRRTPSSARIVRDSLERHVPMAELVETHPALGADAVALLGIGVAVTRRQTAGGTGPDQVAEQRKRFADRLAVDKQRLLQSA